MRSHPCVHQLRCALLPQVLDKVAIGGLPLNVAVLLPRHSVWRLMRLSRALLPR